MPGPRRVRLDSLRSRIDAIDRRILALLNRRARTAREIGEWKKEQGAPIHDSGREKAVLTKLTALNPGPFSASSVERVFRAIIGECRGIQVGPNEPVFGRVSVLGLGLMGTSFALALRKAFPRTQLVGMDPRAGPRAEPFDRIVGTVAEALDADLVVLAAPVGAIADLIRVHGGSFRPGSVVLDLGSAKREICRAAKLYLPRGVAFIGGHPICGKETSGPEGADASLLAGRPFVLCGSKREAIERMLCAIGAVPIRMKPREHDRILAVTSHLPQLTSVALALTAERRLGRRRVVCGPSFLELTRRAMGSYPMWREIFRANQDEVEASLKLYREILGGLASGLPRLEVEFARAGKYRARIGAEKC